MMVYGIIYKEDLITDLIILFYWNSRPRGKTVDNVAEFKYMDLH